jgi:hypothetical protein
MQVTKAPMSRTVLTIGVLVAIAVLGPAAPSLAQPQETPSDASHLPRKAQPRKNRGPLPALRQDDRLIICGDAVGAAACSWQRLHRGNTVRAPRRKAE